LLDVREAPASIAIQLFIIALIAGTSSRPSAVSEYSTDGGDVGMTLRVMTPLRSSSRNRALSTFAEMAGIVRGEAH
jgi:hypothetical protein